MAKVTMIFSSRCDPQWLEWLKSCVKENEDVLWTECSSVYEVGAIQTQAMILICDLNEIGRDEFIDHMIKRWQGQSLRGKRIGMICRSQNDWHTKTYSRSMALIMNHLGAEIIGKALVEILPDFSNFIAWKKTSDLSLEELGKLRVTDLINRVGAFKRTSDKQPRVLVIHTCNETTSNTLALWRLVEASLKKALPQMEYLESYVERGSITDCIGCHYTLCTNEAKQLNCVVGGQFVEEIMPALEWANVIVWLCPNYNDTLSADLIAVINRMSGFYRTRDLSNKFVYAVIVSGNSGTDAVANQLIGSLNLNKGYLLPPQFCLSEIASDPLSVLEKEGIYEKARAFSENMARFICE